MADDAGEDFYPPDPASDGDDGAESTAPVPRAARVRAKALQHQQGQPVTSSVAKKPKMRGGQRKLLAQQKRRHVLELRKSGATFDQIAQSLGYADASGARKAMQKAMKDITQEPAAELKVIQVERYNHMLLTLWSKVQMGDERAIDRALSIMDRLNDLEGLREKAGITVNVDASTHENAVLVVDGNKDDYIAAMKRMVGISPDGKNLPDQIASSPHPVHIPVEDGHGTTVDVVDADVVEETTGEVIPMHQAHGEPEKVEEPVVVTKKNFNFGVDPTVQRKPR